jgi:predicted TIM-barrel fold metal-dependent hydrolase
VIFIAVQLTSLIFADLRNEQMWEYGFYIACEADEDIPYIAQHTGEEHILIGSDYGHNDPSKEPQLVATMRARKDTPCDLIEKILSDNPRKFYSL